MKFEENYIEGVLDGPYKVESPLHTITGTYKNGKPDSLFRIDYQHG